MREIDSYIKKLASHLDILEYRRCDSRMQKSPKTTIRIIQGCMFRDSGLGVSLARA